MQKIATIDADSKRGKAIANWRTSLVRIGVMATVIMMLPVPLILGDSTWWIITGCVPLLLPLFFGNRKTRFFTFTLIILAGVVGYTIMRIEQRRHQQIMELKNRAGQSKHVIDR